MPTSPGASYPVSVKSFSGDDKDLDKDTAIRIAMQEVQQEVTAIENVLKGNADGDISLTGQINAGNLAVNGVSISATASEINNHCDLDTLQAMTANGAITITNGIVTLDKAGVLAATLAAPAAADNGKTITVYSLSAQAHTVTITGSAGGTATDVCTFGAAIGNSITLRAYGQKWYTVGVSGVTVA